MNDPWDRSWRTRVLLVCDRGSNCLRRLYGYNCWQKWSRKGINTKRPGPGRSWSTGTKEEWCICRMLMPSLRTFAAAIRVTMRLDVITQIVLHHLLKAIITRTLGRVKSLLILHYKTVNEILIDLLLWTVPIWTGIIFWFLLNAKEHASVNNWYY